MHDESRIIDDLIAGQKPGPFSEMEKLERRYIEWILQELQRA
ncbi:MAG: hypothetical protein OES10_08160 [Gammaproteobacteria bacterium]|jgi:hypothetical protein|nr:hypothetical protein [Gammaproteobacteria bacterium]MDH3751257.1 hypothetical protein [Gammaproteobacteria bacterium]